MKINGKTYTEPNMDYIVIPRSIGDMVFKVKAVLDLEEFHLLCPKPKPPMGMSVGGQQMPDLSNQAYILSQADYTERRFNYFIVFSLRETEGLEWDTVSYTDPNSWKNYVADLKAAGISEQEINYIVGMCIQVNALNDTKLEEARNRFLALMSLQLDELSSLRVAP
jgi:hypothetical protein